MFRVCVCFHTFDDFRYLLGAHFEHFGKSWGTTLVTFWVTVQALQFQLISKVSLGAKALVLKYEHVAKGRLICRSRRHYRLAHVRGQHSF